MSSEVHKYIEESLEKQKNLFNAEVINFPIDTTNEEDAKLETIQSANLKNKDQSFWRINDKANSDQLNAVIGICFMFGTLLLIGLYSNLL